VASGHTVTVVPPAPPGPRAAPERAGRVVAVSLLRGLALSRSTVDRSAHHRVEAGLVDEVLADEASAIVLLAGDRVLVEGGEGGEAGHDGHRGTGGRADGAVRLALLAPGDVPAPVRAGALPLYLGEDASGRSYLALAVPAVPAEEDSRDDSRDDSRGDTPAVLLPAGTRWAGLREVGALLDDLGAGLFTAAVGLANWHAVHQRCARCGAPTDVIQAGWARRCPDCGAEHYPRTDPAVIMAVVDDDGRLLLGRQAAWPEKRYSTLAGFVEPGESLEAAVRREVAEEAGIEIGEVEYRGSQPWPFPSSLMLGFRAHAVSTTAQADGVELAHARWWSREEFEADLASGDLRLPPRVSIARRLIEDWYGGEVSDAADWAVR
jgi:NAD+ diphosphatase